MGVQRRRLKQLLVDLKKTRSHWTLNAEELDRILQRDRFGRSCGPVVRKTTEWTNKRINVM